MMRQTQPTGRVVVDAMGSDRAPHPEIDGALAATRDFGVEVTLVGQREVVEKELRRCGWRRDGDKGIWFVEAAEFIGMDEAVATAVRRTREAGFDHHLVKPVSFEELRTVVARAQRRVNRGAGTVSIGS